MDNEGKKYISRFPLCAGVIIGLMLLLLLRAGHLMIFKHAYWEKVASRLVKENVTTIPRRGDIISSDGQLMASSLPEFRIFMDYAAGDKKRDSILRADIDTISRGLHHIIPQKSAAAFRRDLLKGISRKKRNLHSCLYRGNISYIQLRDINKLPLFCRGRYKSGFHYEKKGKRKKTFGSLARRTLGDLYGDVSQGARPKNGLELTYDSLLRGKPGVEHRVKVLDKYLSISDMPAEDGADIITTINVKMQDIAEKALLKEMDSINAISGCAIVMEVATGRVRAIANLERASSGRFWESRNCAVQDNYEPGSTFKTASMMVALEDGKVTPDQIVDTGNGLYNMHGRIMRDHNANRGGYGEITAQKALEVSSNIGISRIVDENYYTHPEDFIKGLRRMGLEMPLNLEIRGAADSHLLTPESKFWGRPDLAWLSIGYNSQVTPINMLAFYNAIANNGKFMKPQFVEAIVENDGSRKNIEPEVMIERIASEHTIKTIQMMLEAVVSQGLGSKAGSEHFHVSGKTGTAQVSQGSAGYRGGSTMQYLVSFAGFFPSEKPLYSCIVSIRKSGWGASGGGMAGPVFSEIAEKIYASRQTRDASLAGDSLSVFIPGVKAGNIAAAATVLDKLDIDYLGADAGDRMLWGTASSKDKEVVLTERKYNKKLVPDVRGMGAADAVYLLERLGMRVRISGSGKVRRQSILPGTRLSHGRRILITLR